MASTSSHISLGKWGERIACDFLITQGYAIIETNWRLGHYEIDIIATKGERIIFVEVKTRTHEVYDPLEAVDARKKARMVKAADTFLKSTDLPYDVQYDIITIIGDPHDYTLDFIPDAFLPSVTTRRARR